MINFEECYWDELINESFVPLIENRDRYLILYGGRSSSKSDFTAKKLIFRCLTEKYFKYVLVRTNYNTIKESQYDTIKSIIEEWGIEQYFEFKVSPLEIICKNGNRFICRGCDDPKKLKSIRNPTGVWWEEDVPSYEDFVTITLTVRSNEADYLQEIFTINPEVDGDYNEHWFYKRFFGDRTEPSFSDSREIEIGGELMRMNWTVMHSTYKDNKWARKDNIVQLESYKTEDPHKYLIHTLGLWGNPARDGLFYKKFNRINNVNSVKYNPHIALHISFDFNVRPYLTIVICQLVDKKIYIIDEIAARDPYNNTRDACKIFVDKYKSHRSGIFVYGDPSGKSDSTRGEVGYNDYRIIEQELKEYRPTFRIASKHPPVKKRGEFINDIFSKNWDGLEIVVGDNCHLTINDFINVKEKPDGTKLKEKQDGYEKWAHHSDCFIGETIIKTNNGDVRIDEIKVGDLVLTRKGYKKVLKVWDRGIKKVKTYKIGDNIITCTDNHKFYTKEHGFKEIGHLIGTNTFIIYREKDNILCEKQLNIEVLNSIDTQKRKEDQKEFITQVELLKEKLDYTFTNMNVKLGQFLMDIIFTIKMKTHSITKSITSNVLMQVNTLKNICNVSQEKKNPETHLIYMQEKKHLNGINPKKEESGIENKCKDHYLVRKEKLSASNAKLNSKHELSLNVNSVQGDVRADIMQEYGEQDKRVYDIMVEEEHEFFANNILVHNCVDYLVCEAFKSEFKKYQNGDLDITPIWQGYVPSPKFRL